MSAVNHWNRSLLSLIQPWKRLMKYVCRVNGTFLFTPNAFLFTCNAFFLKDVCIQNSVVLTIMGKLPLKWLSYMFYNNLKYETKALSYHAD